MNAHTSLKKIQLEYWDCYITQLKAFLKKNINYTITLLFNGKELNQETMIEESPSTKLYYLK